MKLHLSVSFTQLVSTMLLSFFDIEKLGRNLKTTNVVLIYTFKQLLTIGTSRKKYK